MSPLIDSPDKSRSQTAFSQKTVVPEPRRSKSVSPPILANIPGLPCDVRHWSRDDVVDWMFNIGVEMQIIERFEQNDINGSVIVDMQLDNLRELGIQSFGKRHQLWASICSLKSGQITPSPTSTPLQDLVPETMTPIDACSPTPSIRDNTPISSEPQNKQRRGRKNRHHQSKSRESSRKKDEVPIVAVEEFIPKVHVCGKGENCSKWKRQQRYLKKLELENGWPVSPKDGGRVMITGDPGNALTAPNILPGVQAPERIPSDTQQNQSGGITNSEMQEVSYDNERPTSEPIVSFIASSALLSPRQMPDFALHEEQLAQLDKRDPQENVKQFLDFQHISPPERMPSAPLQMFPEEHFEMFPNLYYKTSSSPSTPPRVTRKCYTPGIQDHLKALPKLSIPRAATASPSTSTRPQVSRYDTAPSSCTSAVETPKTMYRVGTPASEVDIPVTQPNLGPVARDTSQSVPPNMQYRDPISLTRSQSRAEWRRPSFALPALTERDEPTPTSAISTRTPTNQAATPTNTHTQLSKSQVSYGLDCTHSGWMKKRKTKLLRHEWHDAHFRLKGTQLAMHASPTTASAFDKIDMDDYNVACASAASNNKLASAIKALGIRGGDEKKKKAADPTAFAFQLVPEPIARTGSVGAQKDGKVNGFAAGAGLKRSQSVKAAGKTHHFTVGDRDQRIDWMRELMLAKAKGQREKGFEVRVNGV